MHGNSAFEHDPGRTAPDHRDASLSTGWREIAVLVDAPNAHAVETPGAVACGALGCHASEDLQRVTADNETRVLCPDHAADFLETEVTV